jgi:hypothetical protein
LGCFFGVFCVARLLACGGGGGVMTEVIVQVPDGIYGGDEFTIEYEGTVLSVVCPAGCQPGDEINLSIDLPPAAASGSVEVVVPEGCYPGMEFTVELGERSFNIAVPDGCEPGQAIIIQVPEDGPGTADAASDDERSGIGVDLVPIDGRDVDWTEAVDVFVRLIEPARDEQLGEFLCASMLNDEPALSPGLGRWKARDLRVGHERRGIGADDDSFVGRDRDDVGQAG